MKKIIIPGDGVDKIVGTWDDENGFQRLSAADLAAAGLYLVDKETLVRAKAWENLRKVHEAGIKFKRTGKRSFDPAEEEEHCYQLVEDMKEEYERARAEIAGQEGEEKE